VPSSKDYNYCWGEHGAAGARRATTPSKKKEVAPVGSTHLDKEQQLPKEISQADLRDLPALSKPQGLSGAALWKARRGYRPYGRFAIDKCVSKNRERGIRRA